MVHRSVPHAARVGVPGPDLVLPAIYAELDDDEAVDTARGHLAEINGLNLRENIAPTRERASLIVHKTGDHHVDRVRLRRL